ncbi:NUDIX domain-containing protein [Halobacterium salinarum]|nr:NUDIX domain-containing protein [Halobacterium salinarum]
MGARFCGPFFCTDLEAFEPWLCLFSLLGEGLDVCCHFSGRVQDGGAADEALKRELREETGLGTHRARRPTGATPGRPGGVVIGQSIARRTAERRCWSGPAGR